jgi:hypothetical protein
VRHGHSKVKTEGGRARSKGIDVACFLEEMNDREGQISRL